jgi:hypothetical protein
VTYRVGALWVAFRKLVFRGGPKPTGQMFCP